MSDYVRLKEFLNGLDKKRFITSFHSYPVDKFFRLTLEPAHKHPEFIRDLRFEFKDNSLDYVEFSGDVYWDFMDQIYEMRKLLFAANVTPPKLPQDLQNNYYNWCKDRGFEDFK